MGGVDDISSYPKLFRGACLVKDRSLLSAAGNLATSQAAVNTLSENIKNKKMDDKTILTAPTMFQVAQTVSHTLAEIIDVSARGHQKAENKFSATSF